MKHFKITLLLLGIVFTSCKKDHEPQPYNLQFLFEKDGCKVYKFREGANTVYWTNCNGQLISKTDYHFQNHSYHKNVVSQVNSK